MVSDNLLNARNEYRKVHDLLTQNQIFTIKEIYRVAPHLSDENATFLFIISITIVIKYGSYLVNKHHIKYICAILHNMVY